MQWQQVDDVNSASGNKNSSYVSGFNNYISPNPYRKLIIDDANPTLMKNMKNMLRQNLRK